MGDRNEPSAEMLAANPSRLAELLNSSLKASEADAAAVAVAPRVRLSDIEAAAARYDIRGSDAVGVPTNLIEPIGGSPARLTNPLGLLSLCILVMRNGFTVVGTSAPASPENFDAELGRKLAYEHAIRQLWPLMGYALRDRLAAA